MDEMNSKKGFWKSLGDTLFPPWYRRMFPFYLVVLPKSAPEYRDSCRNLSVFYAIIAGFNALLLKTVSHFSEGVEKAPKISAFLIAGMVVLFLSSVFSYFWFKWKRELDSTGILLVAILLFLPFLFLFVDSRLETFSANGIVQAVGVFQLLIVFFVFARFLRKGIAFLRAERVKEVA